MYFPLILSTQSISLTALISFHFLSFKVFVAILIQLMNFPEALIFLEKMALLLFRFTIKMRQLSLIQLISLAKPIHILHSEQDLLLAWVTYWVVNTDWPKYPDYSWIRRQVSVVFWVYFKLLVDFYEFDWLSTLQTCYMVLQLECIDGHFLYFLLDLNSKRLCLFIS